MTTVVDKGHTYRLQDWNLRHMTTSRARTGRLTPRQAEFVRQYLLDMCGSAAAIRAGYSRRTADQIAHQLLQKNSVRAAVAEAIKNRTARLELDADDVARELIGDVEADIADIFFDDGTPKPVPLWPPNWRNRGLVESLEISEKVVSGGPNRGRKIRIVRIRFANRLTRLELLGRHLGVF